MCEHLTCKKIKSFRTKNNATNRSGAGVILLNNYYGHDKYVVLLGKERGGKYKGEYNICAGGMEKCDNFCYIQTAISSSNFNDFGKIFRDSSGKIRYIMHRNNPVFIGTINGVKRKDINDRIEKDNLNFKMKNKFHEIKCVDYFWLDGTQIENRPCEISTYASSVIQKIDTKRL